MIWRAALSENVLLVAQFAGALNCHLATVSGYFLDEYVGFSQDIVIISKSIQDKPKSCFGKITGATRRKRGEASSEERS